VKKDGNSRPARLFSIFMRLRHGEWRNRYVERRS